MGAFEDFTDLIKKTETMQSLLQSLEKEPAKLLAAVCREYEVTNKAVPDHHLNLAGYSGEAMLRALVSANLITRERGDRFSIYGYKPTEAGLKYYKAMLKEKKI
jgi:DNA-binding MarR family transcriptional regulator